MDSKPPYELTPGQRALAQERKMKKQAKQAGTGHAGNAGGATRADLILPRAWLATPSKNTSETSEIRVKVLTWNLLAQTLVRRELFPTSDCLKAGQREGMTQADLLSHDADILFLQEVDRLEKLEPFLTKAGYSHQYGSGPRKKHGYFNFGPDDPAYSLLVGDPLSPEHNALLSPSRVVHASIDPIIETSTQVDKGDGEGESDPDRIITNARPATATDGLLTNDELTAMARSQPPWQSVYDLGLSQLTEQKRLETNIRTFGDRSNLSTTRKGSHEPEWTSYTHYWKATLDTQTQVHGVLQPPATNDLDPGLPKKGVSASDHISLSAEIGW
ncbi:hypothetical protein ONZ45_g1851 [Pleurotus djamor]|nr:hypothetical protein ONZ45_g1851 [Pleurotus djamor]